MLRRRRNPRPVVRRRTKVWSPAQLVAGLIGVASLVLGSFAIARTGLNTHRLSSPHVSVATLHHTPLLALCELAFGLLMLWAAFMRLLGRGFMALLGLAVLGLGVVTVADLWTARLHHWLGVSHRNGWLFILVGGLSFLTGLFVPALRTRRKVIEGPARPVIGADTPTPEREHDVASHVGVGGNAVGDQRISWRPETRNGSSRPNVPRQNPDNPKDQTP
jgi:hypothetical protein